MRFYANENFPAPSVVALRALGHDAQTTQDAGLANQAIPDEHVIRYAHAEGRIVLTLNRKDFIRIHRAGGGGLLHCHRSGFIKTYNPNATHTGIITCFEDRDYARLARRIDDALARCGGMTRALLQLAKP